MARRKKSTAITTVCGTAVNPKDGQKNLVTLSISGSFERTLVFNPDEAIGLARSLMSMAAEAELGN